MALYANIVNGRGHDQDFPFFVFWAGFMGGFGMGLLALDQDCARECASARTSGSVYEGDNIKLGDDHSFIEQYNRKRAP